MYWIDSKEYGRGTITGKQNKSVMVHGITGHTIEVTVELNCGMVLHGNMNLIEFIDMMEVSQ